MSDKFLRNYELTITYSNGNKVIVTMPFTLEFNVVRSTAASAMTATFDIYNLSEQTRNLLFHDYYDFTTISEVVFRAGYENFIPIVFQGNVKWAWSARRGVDWVTSIEAWSGGYKIINSDLGNSEKGGGYTRDKITYKQVFTDLAKKMVLDKSVKPIIGNFPDTAERGVALAGNTWGQIKSILPDNAHMFIDNEVPFIVNKDEVIQHDFDTLDSSMGLLNTPKRQATYVEISMIFEPRIRPCQQIKLNSLEKVYNATYKVMGIVHMGTISEAICGNAITNLTLFNPSRLVLIS
jgi:hypothetical protein